MSEHWNFLYGQNAMLFGVQPWPGAQTWSASQCAMSIWWYLVRPLCSSSPIQMLSWWQLVHNRPNVLHVTLMSSFVVCLPPSAASFFETAVYNQDDYFVLIIVNDNQIANNYPSLVREEVAILATSKSTVKWCFARIQTLNLIQLFVNQSRLNLRTARPTLTLSFLRRKDCIRKTRPRHQSEVGP